MSIHFIVSRHENQENTIIKASNTRLKKKTPPQSSEQPVSKMTCCKQARQHWLQLSCHRKKKHLFLFLAHTEYNWSRLTYLKYTDTFQKYHLRLKITIPGVTASNTQRFIYVQPDKNSEWSQWTPVPCPGFWRVTYTQTQKTLLRFRTPFFVILYCFRILPT